MSKKLEDLLEISLITYNRAEDLKNTLNQLIDSPISVCDITILDNASTDNTEEIVNSFKDRLKLTYIKNNKNIGGNANIVRGFEIANKPYVWVLCDDDNYKWSAWPEIEKHIMEEKADVIFVQDFYDTESERVYHAAGVYLAIYKTSNIDSTSLVTMYNNVVNMFPHAALYISILNKGGYVVHPHVTVVYAGVKNWSGETYNRGLDKSQLTYIQKTNYWFVCYMRTLALINDVKFRSEIINGTKHCCDSFENLLAHKLWQNMAMHNSSGYNFRSIYYILDKEQRKLYKKCYKRALTKYRRDGEKALPQTESDWVNYFKKVNNINKLREIVKKNKGKKVAIYGAGSVTKALMRIDNDIFKDIKYISDIKYNNVGIDKDIEEFICLPPENLKELNPDVILVSLLRFKEVTERLKNMGVNSKFVKIIHGWDGL